MCEDLKLLASNLFVFETTKSFQAVFKHHLSDKIEALLFGLFNTVAFFFTH